MRIAVRLASSTPEQFFVANLTRNFGWRSRLSERLQDLLFRESWPAAITARIWPPTLHIWREQLALPRPLGAARTLKIAFASDLHAGPLTPPSLFDAACAALMAAEPDLILLGGDFVAVSHRHARALVQPLRTLKAPLGVHAVLGNHDHWAGASEITAMLDDAGVNLLNNRSHRLPAPYDNTLLVGLDDHLSGYPDAARAVWDPERTTLLLIHQPSGLLDVGERPFDVAFAGHTHGGQITMPGGYAPVVPAGALSRRYLRGRYELERGRTLLVSVGVGNSSLPLRFGPRPEILVCDATSLRVSP